MELLPVPYLSQYRDVIAPKRRRSACSVTCLSMVLAHLLPEDAPSPDALYDEGESIGARDARGDWTHDGIVRLARNHGLLAYPQEFRSRRGGEPSRYEPEFMNRGVEKIRSSIARGTPVIISITRRGGSTNHTVVVVGANEGGFVMHDPDAQNTQDGKNIYLSMEEFQNIWRGLAIFFER